MAWTKKYKYTAAIFLAALLISCTAYHSREISFKHPSYYLNMQTVAGAQIAAQAHDRDAKDLFGFDIRGAGLFPVQIIIDNTGEQQFEVVPSQTFLIDDQGNMWNLLRSETAYSRLEQSGTFEKIASGSGKGAILGAAGGALVGAAIGIVSRTNVAIATGQGAAIGGAGGAVLGGAHGANERSVGEEISRDLAARELKNKVIAPGVLTHGFLFFPGEAPSARTLRLQMAEVGTGQTHTLFFDLAHR